MAVPRAIRLCAGKREPLLAVGAATAIADVGLPGDRLASAGSDRHVLGIDVEVLHALGLRPRPVRKNLAFEGPGLQDLPAGTALRIGGVRLEARDVCTGCARMDEVRPGLRAALEGRRGRYLPPLEEGTIRRGDEVTARARAP